MRRPGLLALVAAVTFTAFPSQGRPVRHTPLRQPQPAQPAPQEAPPQPQPPPAIAQPAPPSAPIAAILPYPSAREVLEAPVSRLLPGNTGPSPAMKNPVGGDPEAIQRGMGYFNMFNCSGCHAPNAGGGMGPSLSNSFFIYGGEPQNIYLSIYQGRPNGMPSWGAMLPENVIWDLVAYIHSISRDPAPTWGKTVSREALKIEQVPAEFSKTATPWSETERFSFGQKPNETR
ncbi:MAG: di-heme cytochrome c [Hyphomicrobiales bacterium]|nr:MAG: di-heme cytochrome c [Hyphomicrobiales bacterium]